MAAATLYTPEVLALATSLARYPLDPTAPLQGAARSPTCGSAITLSLTADAGGRIEALGLRAQACAMGQAASAVFVDAAKGHDAASLAEALAAIEHWLKHGGALPDWPGIGAIAAAQAYPARHGALLLPWKAALAALSTAAHPG